DAHVPRADAGEAFQGALDRGGARPGADPAGGVAAAGQREGSRHRAEAGAPLVADLLHLVDAAGAPLLPRGDRDARGRGGSRVPCLLGEAMHGVVDVLRHPPVAIGLADERHCPVIGIATLSAEASSKAPFAGTSNGATRGKTLKAIGR